jgi:hypothetical protein
MRKHEHNCDVVLFVRKKGSKVAYRCDSIIFQIRSITIVSLFIVPLHNIKVQKT